MAAFEAGSVIARFKADLTQFKQSIGQAKQSLGETKTATTQLSTAFGGVTRLAGLFGVALGAAGLVSGMRDAITASVQLTRSMMGLSQVARAFGVDANEAEAAAKSLAADGLMSVAEASEALKNLLATGFSLPQAIDLMRTFKDASAANRQGTLGFGEAIVGATIGIKNQNSVLVDNVGISKNLSVILKEQGLSVDALQEVTSDAGIRQKLFNGLMREGSIFTGAAGDAAQTTGGKMDAFKTQLFNAAATVGDVLSPALEMLMGALSGGLSSAAGSVNNQLVNLKLGFLGLATVVTVAAQIIIGAFRIVSGAIAALAAGDFNLFTQQVNRSVGAVVNTIDNYNKKSTEIVKGESGKQTSAVKTNLNQQSAAHSKKADKMAKDLERETEKYAEELGKRKKQFDDDLADMVRAHIEKRDKLVDDIKDENAEYSAKMTERERDFKEHMSDMIADHARKVSDIKAQIADENAAFKQSIDDAKDNYDEKVNDMAKSHEEAVGKIKDQIQEETDKAKEANKSRIRDLEERLNLEVAKGRNADQTRIDALKTRLADEIANGMVADQKKIDALQARLTQEDVDNQDATTKVKATYDEEVKKATEANQQKLADLNQRLTDEDAQFTQQRERDQRRYDEETTQLKATHDKRLADYQLSLAAEQTVLNNHKDEVAKVKNQEKEDDITRLKTQFAEENVASAKEHERRLVDIRERGDELGTNLGMATNNALADQQPKIEKTVQDIAESAGEKLVTGIGNAALDAGRAMINNLWSGIKNQAERVGGFFIDNGNALSKSVGDAFKGLGSLHFDEGGIVPGARGQAQMAVVHGGETILPTHKSPMAGTTNVYVDMSGAKISSTDDAKRAGEAMGDQIIKKLQNNIRI